MRLESLLRFRKEVCLPAVSGAEHHFQRRLATVLRERRLAPGMDVLGNLFVRIERTASPAIMVAAFVDEPGWFVRSVAADGAALLEPTGDVYVPETGTLLRVRTGGLARMTLSEEDGVILARSAADDVPPPCVADAVAPGWGRANWRVSWSVAMLQALIERWHQRAFAGTLAVCFLTRGRSAPRSTVLCGDQIRPDFALFVDGVGGRTERVEIPRGPALFDHAQRALERCARRCSVPFESAFMSMRDGAAVAALQETPPGYQVSMLRFTTTEEASAALAASKLVDRFLETMFGGEEQASLRTTESVCAARA